MSVTIRAATIEDADRLALVGGAAFLETFAGILDGRAIMSHCQREHSVKAYQCLLTAGAQAWLAEVEPGGAPVGFALLGATDLPGSAVDGSDLELKRIYLLSHMIGQGSGRTLLEHAISSAKSRGATRLLLGVYANNRRAIAFYERQGFTQIADRQFRVGDVLYEDRVMARSLDLD